ncbi:MAG: hypothetical protein MN733_10515 [Nitrososphaera sp.]|nr:hypothetical protein [Nitrososphaera sp.]
MLIEMWFFLAMHNSTGDTFNVGPMADEAQCRQNQAAIQASKMPDELNTKEVPRYKVIIPCWRGQ